MSHSNLCSSLAACALAVALVGPAHAEQEGFEDEWLGPQRARDGGTRSGMPKAARPQEPLEKLSLSDIMEVVLANKAGLQECMLESLRRAPDKTGKVVIRWTIDVSGETRRVKVVSETKKGTPFTACAVELIKRWRFPRHRTQGEPIEFPFKVWPPAPPCDGGSHCDDFGPNGPPRSR